MAHPYAIHVVRFQRFRPVLAPNDLPISGGAAAGDRQRSSAG